jgi:hypothetical protein
MFKPTDRQMPLLSPVAQLAEGAQRRLRLSWADGFQRHVLPILLDKEDEFSHLYDDATGRPNWSVARLLGLHILQQLEGLTDQQVVDALAFDVRYQHALGLRAEDAYLSRRSHVQFRARLVAADPQMALLRGVFEAVGAAAIDDLKLTTSAQRIDSTLITSNIRTRGRVDLFSKTIALFLDELTGRGPARLESLSRALVQWYDKRGDGSFAAVDKERNLATLDELARWVLELIDTFASDEAIADTEPYALLTRLFSEHCVLDVSQDDDADDADDADQDDGTAGHSPDAPKRAVPSKSATAPSKTPQKPKKLTVLKHPSVGGGSMQSPHDPDASFGHKGRGYHVQATETCGNIATEILTDYDVLGAHVSDHGQAQRALERLRTAGLRPDTLYADSGYGSGKALVAAEAMGTKLYSPVLAPCLPDGHIGRERFAFDHVTGEVLQCPEGHAPVRHGLRSTTNATDATPHAYFDGKTCRACSLQGRCVVRGPNNAKAGNFHMELLPRLIARDQALARQREPSWWTPYRIRAGVEATMSELKGPHGLGRLRVRRRTKVELMVSLKLTACNVKRWLSVRRPTNPTTRPTSSPATRPFRALNPLWRPLTHLRGLAKAFLTQTRLFPSAA